MVVYVCNLDLAIYVSTTRLTADVASRRHGNAAREKESLRAQGWSEAVHYSREHQ